MPSNLLLGPHIMAPESEGDFRESLRSWLNQTMRIKMTDGRTLIGQFLCTDRDRNVILGSCEEYLTLPECGQIKEPRVLGLAMIPGQHIVSVEIDQINLG